MEAKINTSKIFPIILFVIAFPLVLGGLQLLFLGGSIYYLVAGLALAYSGWCFWHEDPQGSLVYASLLFLTIAWSFMEAGTNLWALAPRILPFAVLGSWLLTPWQRNVLYDGNPPPLFASSIAKAAVPLSLVIIVFVFVDDTGYEVSEMSARSGINTVNSATDWPSYGNSEKGTRYSPLDQINTDNVEGLELAWTYRTGAGGAFKATPLMVGELLFMCTGGNRILALNAESGELAWQFDPLIDSEHVSQSRYFTTG